MRQPLIFILNEGELLLRTEIFGSIRPEDHHENREEEKQAEDKEEVFAEGFCQLVTVDDHDNVKRDQKDDRQRVVDIRLDVKYSVYRTA